MIKSEVHDNFQVRLIGRLTELPENIQNQIKLINQLPRVNPQNFINFRVVDDGQKEIVDMMKSILKANIPYEQIITETINKHLYTKDFPELDSNNICIPKTFLNCNFVDCPIDSGKCVKE